MKLKFLATGQSPDYYEFDGEKITARSGDSFEEFDLSVIEHGGKFEVVEVDTLPLPATQIIRDAFRDEHGEIHVTLTEKSPMRGNWRESDWLDVEDYHPMNSHIRAKVGDDLVDPVKKYVKVEGEWVARGDLNGES